MKVLILNVYSAANRGDGLLAELAHEFTLMAMPQVREITVSAHDPDSFADHTFSAISPFGSSQSSEVALRGLVALLTSGRVGFTREFRERARQADLIISVGGAYLRGADAIELAKALLVHGSQMSYASRLARRGKAWVLLPQSIGPFKGAVWSWLTRQLGPARSVFLRDDKSFHELRGLPNVLRVADSAVLALPMSSTKRRDRGSKIGVNGVGVILRALPRSGEYLPHLKRLLANDFAWVPVLQSRRGGNDDQRFYRSLGMNVSTSLVEAVDSECITTCLSVRLHGSLEAILLGVPAIHLSYERKGFSAFKDLGLERYVFDARSFDEREVAERLLEIRVDPAAYWSAIAPRLPDLRGQLDQVLRTLQSAGGFRAGSREAPA